MRSALNQGGLIAVPSLDDADVAISPALEIIVVDARLEFGPMDPVRAGADFVVSNGAAHEDGDQRAIDELFHVYVETESQKKDATSRDSTFDLRQIKSLDEH
jgi:hypothetical protein